VPGDGLALGLGEGLVPGEGLGLGDGLAVGKGLGLGDGSAPPTTVMVDRTPLRASSIWTVPETQKVNENDWPALRSSLSRKL
jgi:hypothetical protein